MKSSIRHKILRLNLSGLLLCALLIGGVSIILFDHYIEQGLEQKLDGYSEKETAAIEATFKNIEQYVKTLSTVIMEDVNSVSILSNDSSREEFTQQSLNIIRISIKNITGVVAVYLRYNPKFTPPTSGIFMAKTTKNGRIKPLTPTDFSKYDPDDVEHVGWYYIPIKNKSPLWMDPYENKNIDIYMISYVAPLFLADREIGVIGMDIDFNYLTSRVADIKLFKTGYAYLEYANGSIAYHPTMKMGEYFKNDGNYIIRRTSLSNNMRLVFVSPKSEIYEDINRLIRDIVLFAIGIFFIFVIISIFFSRSITRPLTQLTLAANKMTSGDMSVTFDTNSDDEIGDLCRSFDKARFSIQQYLDHVKSIAYKDTLTGVRNKTAFDSYIKEFKENVAKQKIDQFGIVFLDVNYLKLINDTYGHDHGNLLLINACNLICLIFSHSPVFRVGGDEFVVILLRSDYERREELLKFMREKIIQLQKDSSDPWEKVSIAAGLALYNGTDSVEEVIKQADEAMYQNKKEMKAARED